VAAGRTGCRGRELRLSTLLMTALLVPLLTGMLAGRVAAETTLRMVPFTNLRTVDPIWTTSGITLDHGYMVYDTLFAMDREYRPQPQMVDKYTVTDGGMKYTFTLRKGLMWHDGTPVTARDCVASLKRWAARDGLGGRLMAAARSLDIESSTTFSLTLKEPFGPVLEALAKPAGFPTFMMPERIASTDPFKAIEDSVGSGPFKFVKEEWVQGAKVVYVKNRNYVPRHEPASMFAGGKRVNVDRVEWLSIPDAHSAVAALNKGEVDYLETVPHDLGPLVTGSPNSQLMKSAPWQLVLVVNHSQPPFNNEKVRKALYYMIRQESYLLATVGNPEWFQPCWAMFGCGNSQESTAGSESFREDLDRARQLLKEGGYAGEKVVILDGVDLPAAHMTVPVTAQFLRKAGMNVEVQSMDFSAMASRRTSNKPVAEGGWSIFHTTLQESVVMYPVSHLAIDARCEKAWAFYCDSGLETLKTRWVQIADAAQRRTVAVDIQKRAYEQGAYVPLGQMTYAWATSKKLSGWLQTPTTVMWNWTKE
jgi:peptide/nickel transport system substrate-binding protein